MYFAALASALLLGAGVLSEGTPKPQSLFGGGGGPLGVDAGSLERDGELHTVLIGNVELTKADSRLRSPKIDLFNSVAVGSKVAQLYRIEAAGPVYFIRPGRSAKGDHATYVAAEDKLVVTGNVILVEGKNVLTGERLDYYNKTDRAVLTGKAGERMRGVLYTDEKRELARASLSVRLPPLAEVRGVRSWARRISFRGGRLPGEVSAAARDPLRALQRRGGSRHSAGCSRFPP